MGEHYDPKKIVEPFVTCKAAGVEHCIVMKGDDPWLCWRHPDGQWVTECKVDIHQQESEDGKIPDANLERDAAECRAIRKVLDSGKIQEFTAQIIEPPESEGVVVGNQNEREWSCECGDSGECDKCKAFQRAVRLLEESWSHRDYKRSTESESVLVKIFAIRHSHDGPLEAEFSAGDLGPEEIAAALGLTKEYETVSVWLTREQSGG